MVAHEWGHYISDRLIGNGNGLNSRQAKGLGEGWGDFHGLLLTIQNGSMNLDGTLADCAYAFQSYKQAYYFGSRRYPYSIDFVRNPLTFQHISPDAVLPPDRPINPNITRSINNEVHRIGEVWATMLWECYAALLKDAQGPNPRLSFAEAQDRMKRYLVAAYKLTPVEPTFIEARDALLTVAFAEDVADGAVFLMAFARRGIGVGARGPDRYDPTVSYVEESYSSEGTLQAVSFDLSEDPSNCNQDGEITNNEVGILTITLRNLGAKRLSSTTATVDASNPHLLFSWGNTIQFPPADPLESTTATIRFAVQGAVGMWEDVFVAVVCTDPDLSRTVEFMPEFYVNRQSVPNSSTSDDMETRINVWSTETLGISNNWSNAGWRRNIYYIFGPYPQNGWNAPDPSAEPDGSGAAATANGADMRLTSPDLLVSTSSDFILTFKHRYYFFYEDGVEYYDGGVVEISNDGGASWVDANVHATPAYTQTLLSGRGDYGQPVNRNPLAGRLAYAGMSADYGFMPPESLNFGRTYAGQHVKVRFRVGSYFGAYGPPGWEIDDIAFSGIDNTPFPSLAAGTDCSLPSLSILQQPMSPTVTLDDVAVLSVAADAGSVPLTYQWYGRSATGQFAAIPGATSSTYTTPTLTANDDGSQYFVRVFAGAAFVDSSTVSLTVVPVTIVSQPSAQTVTAGQSAVFTVTARGRAPLHYQWKHDGIVVGADSSTLTISNAQPSDAGSYTATVSNDLGSATSTVAALTVTSVPPVITTQPQSQTVTVGQSVTFAVTATGTPPLHYQWRKNGAAIGADAGSFTISNVQATDAGSYTVTVTNAGGSASSGTAVLAVNSPGMAPFINTQPQTRNVMEGQPVTFTVLATGTAPLHYQWRKNGAAIGADAASFTISAVQASDGGNYTVTVSNTVGSVTSATAMLIVMSVPPAITSQPQSQTVTVGQNVTFTVTATGTAPLHYQWRKNGATVGGDSASLTLSNVQTSDAATYTVMVTNAVGSATSGLATLTVRAVAPVITSQPQSQTKTAGQSVTFTVTATGTPPLNYQWKKNGNAVGGNSSSFTISRISASDAGNYTVTVSNAAGRATSNTASLIVR